jgi:L-iditol 2-dehydrogenase
MRAAVFYGPGRLVIEDAPDPIPGPGEIVVQVRAAATCGTDLKSYRRGHPKLFPTLPAPFGHEFAGVVAATAPDVTTFRPGMRVVAANTAPCRSCWACTQGRESLCENLFFLNGAFAEQILIPAPVVERNTYELPEHVPFEAAAPLEPLATVVHGMAETGIRLGDTVVVHGAGPIGLMFVRLSTLRGATVVAVDQSSYRLAEAKRMGAGVTVDISGCQTPEARVAAIRDALPEARGADVAIEAVGHPEVWEQAITSLRPGGTAVLFGGPQPGSMVRIDPVAMHYNEYTLKGVFHHTPYYVRTALRLLSTGAIDGRDLVTATRPLDALVESLEDMAAGRGSKYILTPSTAGAS